MRELFKRTHFRGRFDYPPEDLLESQSWWYVPYRWIGCFGFIVDKDSGYVNWLGSALMLNLSHCFWGHDRGLYCDLVDFSFAPDTKMELARALLPKFKHMNPNAQGVPPKEPTWYRDADEIESALSSHFPLFKRHLVWLAIPEIQKAYEKDGLRFTSVLAAGT